MDQEVCLEAALKPPGVPYLLDPPAGLTVAVEGVLGLLLLYVM